MLPRVPLCLLPTPMHRLDRASAELGVDLWIKRDDLTGFALGGNKGRKLEFLMADVVASGAEVVVSCGSMHSNFLRQLAAACARLGLASAAAVMALPYEDARPVGGDELEPGRGNPPLTRLFGMDLRVLPDGDWDGLFLQAERLAAEHEAAGRRVYRIPVGGSAPQGAWAFVEAAREVTERFDAILFASSSGSTHTGLQTAFRGTDTRIAGIACDPEPLIAEEFADLSRRLSDLTGLPRLAASDYDLDFGFVGDGYGLVSEGSREAIAFLARTEGILLDPIYTGKAFSALLANPRGYGERVLFWHTGGVPSLFAMR